MENLIIRGIFALMVLTLVTVESYARSDVINVTTQTGVIQGTFRDVTTPDGGLYQVGLFLGIPYAKPPLGSRRFQKPVSTLSPGPFFRAHSEGQACPQNVAMLKGWVPGPTDMSEDCLKLNVYVPLDSSCLRSNGARNHSNDSKNDNRCSKKAVMLWIHGGAYIIGQSRIYDAQRLASVGDIIVITINYRLGSLGFLSTGDGVVRGNAGLWDQQAAIEWVSANIESFGGDPNRITLSGESAGGASSIYQLLYPSNRGKIARVAVSSGTPLCPWAFSKETTAKFATRLAQRVGCGYDYLPGFGVERHVKMVKCLQSKSFQEIINNSNVGSLTETLFRAEWVPTIDGEFLKETPSNILKWPSEGYGHASVNSSSVHAEGNSLPSKPGDSLLADVDAMVGSNFDDGEVVAKITVRNLLKSIAGVDFVDDALTSEIVEKYYFPQIILEHVGKLKPELFTAITEVYRNSLNKTTPLNENAFTRRFGALREVLESTTDLEFLMPTIQTVTSMANANRMSTTLNSPRHFLFQFNKKYPYLSRPDWNLNAAHGDDLPYIFGFPVSMATAFNITDEVEHREWNTSKVVMTYWANFVKSGSPNMPGAVPTAWSQFKDGDMKYLTFTDDMSSANSKSNLFPERFNFWRNTMNTLA